MADLPREMVLRSLLEVLREAYEGPPDPSGTWFVNNQPDCGVFGTLAALPAAEASRAPGPGRPSAAAHAGHLRFSLDASARWIRGERARLNWGESWAVSAVDEPAWAELQDDLRRAYEDLRGTVERLESLDHDSLTGAVGALAHAAYHLGALRQVAAAVRAPDEIGALHGGEHSPAPSLDFP